MKLLHRRLVYAFLVIALAKGRCSYGEQLPTLFVLETSDSSPDSYGSPMHEAGHEEPERNSAETSDNTRVITDEGPTPLLLPLLTQTSRRPAQSAASAAPPPQQQLPERLDRPEAALDKPKSKQPLVHFQDMHLRQPQQQHQQPQQHHSYLSPAAPLHTLIQEPGEQQSVVGAQMSPFPAHEESQVEPAAAAGAALDDSLATLTVTDNEPYNQESLAQAWSSHGALQEPKRSPIEEVTTVRRLEEEASQPQPPPAPAPAPVAAPSARPSSRAPAPASSPATARPAGAASTAPANRPKSAPSAAPGKPGNESAGTTPKTEDRLLISITNDDDEPGYNQPFKPGVDKRKPQITISIQDPNLLKQPGPGQQVIVRPSENGQGFVIATVDLNRPNGQPALIQQAGGGQRPAAGGASSLRPPANVNAGGNPTSTLIDQPRPPLNGGGGGGGGQQRPPPLNRPPPPSQGAGSLPADNFGDDNQRQPLQQFEAKFPLNEKNCGVQYETRIVGGEEADPDDFQWMAAIIKSKPVNGEARPFCGGSLITRRHVLTAAHCLENLAPRDVLVRLGSYDFDDNTASSMSADYAIDQFRVPASYSKKTHVADIAIMRLKTPISVNENYKTVCMPQARRSYVGALATVTGYGSQSQTFRRAAPKLRQVTVPVWENRKCSVVYKRNLTDSFLCAGYDEGGKDACQGDSGGPLMTEGPNEKMMVIGVVSHGIGCGSPGYPGVYTRTTTFIDWIEKNTRE